MVRVSTEIICECEEINREDLKNREKEGKQNKIKYNFCECEETESFG
jgi:hypothetical protein